MEEGMTISLFAIRLLLAGIGGYCIGRYGKELLERFGILNYYLQMLIVASVIIWYSLLIGFLIPIQ
jgi:hypothetical protein